MQSTAATRSSESRRAGGPAIIIIALAVFGAVGVVAWPAPAPAKPEPPKANPELEAARSEIVALRRQLEAESANRDQRLARLAARIDASGASIKDDLTNALASASQTELDRRFQVYETLMEQLTTRQEERQFAELTQIEGRFEKLIQRMDDQAIAIARARETDNARFRRIQREFQDSVFLIHCRFDYLVKDDDGSTTTQSGSGWGTGFLATEKGHIVTNKHVVQPWKFDSEIATMAALDEVEVLEGSVKITAWPTGTTCMDEDRNPITEYGYHTAKGGGLHLVVTSPDTWRNRTTDFGLGEVTYRVHTLDDRDLAILRLEDSDFQPLPLAESCDDAGLGALDPVLTIGFPRGLRGLEAQRAITSPSMGTVRKIENTIHVTASIIPGNSGGPLFDRHGMVVGVATRVYSETLGICIRVERIRELLAIAEK